MLDLRLKKIYLVLLPVLSGLLFSAAWPANGIPWLLFIAFLPLLFIEDYISVHKHRFNRFSVFFYSYPAFFIWNLLTTWWIWNSTPVAVFAWLLNALFMAVVFWAYHYVRQNLFSTTRGYYLLVFFWITFEFIHLRWELSWPWLNLGNGFASAITAIQWYEYTGTLGGTLWILTVNIFLYLVIKEFSASRRFTRIVARKCISGGMLILIPVVISWLICFTYRDKGEKQRIIIVQANMDPYSEQYTVPPLEVLGINLNLAMQHLEPSVNTIIACPESSIQEDIWENHLNSSASLDSIRKFIQRYPKTALVIGASTYRRYLPGEELPYSVRYLESADFWYDAYNTVFYADTSPDFQYRHKSKLTLGVEKMPSWRLLAPLQKLAVNLGGTVGTLGFDREQVPFNHAGGGKFATIVCYESVYGEFCSRFVQNGAEYFILITNDGWWGNTPGHKQHLSFTHLRAIETRRSFARSANTGISGFAGQTGKLHKATPYWTREVISGDVSLNAKQTFYVRFGDYVGRIAMIVSSIIVAMTLLRIIKKTGWIR